MTLSALGQLKLIYVKNSVYQAAKSNKHMYLKMRAGTLVIYRVFQIRGNGRKVERMVASDYEVANDLHETHVIENVRNKLRVKMKFELQPQENSSNNRMKPL